MSIKHKNVDELLQFSSLFNDQQVPQLQEDRKGFERGFQEGQESAFRKVIEALRAKEYVGSHTEIKLYNEAADWLRENKSRILGDEK